MGLPRRADDLTPMAWAVGPGGGSSSLLLVVLAGDYLPMTKQKQEGFSIDSYAPLTGESNRKDLREGFPTRYGESPKGGVKNHLIWKV